jgi:MoxR-like ATPase
MQVSITQDIQKRVAAIEIEVNSVVKERADVVHGMLVALIGKLHLVMLGAGGSGKSFMVRDFVSHIVGATGAPVSATEEYFETQLFESSDPGDVIGGTDIKALAKDGKSRRVPEAMLPEAEYAFIDEIFNANGPLLKSLHAIMNERVFHNPRPTPVPLRSLYSATNKLITDGDLAAFFDRIHLRYTVEYLKVRQNEMDMVAEAIARMAQVGRGTSTSLATSTTLVTLDDLDIAFEEAMGLNVSDEVFNTFFDLSDELRSEGIVVSNRRQVDGMNAVLANAWLRNHEEVQITDLDILAHMWWVQQDQVQKAQEIILGVANPSAKLALDLMTTLDQIKSQYEATESLDATVQTRARIECVRNTNDLLKEAGEELAAANGADTSLLAGVISQAEAFKEMAHRAVGL